MYSSERFEIVGEDPKLLCNNEDVHPGVTPSALILQERHPTSGRPMRLRGCPYFPECRFISCFESLYETRCNVCTLPIKEGSLIVKDDTDDKGRYKHFPDCNEGDSDAWDMTPRPVDELRLCCFCKLLIKRGELAINRPLHGKKVFHHSDCSFSTLPTKTTNKKRKIATAVLSISTSCSAQKSP